MAPADSPADYVAIPPAVVEHILLGPTDDRRVLQDSPILADVWLSYAANPAAVQDLLITPHKSATAANVAHLIRSGLTAARRIGEGGEGAKVAYLQGIVAARLYFQEVLQILVPETQWWKQGSIADKLGHEDPRTLRERLTEIFSPDTYQELPNQSATVRSEHNFSALERYIALAGLILWIGKKGDKDLSPTTQADGKIVLRLAQTHIAEILEGLLSQYADVVQRQRPGAQKETPEEEVEGTVFQIALNRRASAALDKSIPAVKADAARTLFNVDCSKIVWAVLNSGVSSTHPAFLLENGTTRVKKTFDFRHIREILSGDQPSAGALQGVDLSPADAQAGLKQIAHDATEQNPINWGVVEKFVTVSKPNEPVSPHGTHVAGIIGADGKGKRQSGMCPDIRIYDFRVLGKTLEETEFAIIAALQYIRYVNERHSFITIHGANLSLSIPHNVRNYACGRTPVCVECERLVESGVVVVAAAGNRGFQKFQTSDGVFENYAAFSITDPGNGDGVITVGATHGNWPHTYGVSFFSSRGPTGDGRLKPDLVAPGERVRSTVLSDEWGAESGTSMAAPHVSGAAAMLMARHAELIGQPRRLKKILCDSATDLGRERSFQGYGMLDVLRALQSV